MNLPSEENVSIIAAITDQQIIQTRGVMLQLRPDISVDAYLPTVRRMMESDGYRLAAIVAQDVVRAVAGYRYMEMLYCGKIMYVDDLNTDPQCRSKGYGKSLMDWLKNEAKMNGCGQLHLDTGVHLSLIHI